LEPTVDLAPGSERLALARELAAVVRQNIADHAEKRAEFCRLRGAVAVVADDTGVALTLRFEYGRLVVHAGVVGIPDVTLRGSAERIRDLAALPALTVRGLARSRSDARLILGSTVRSLRGGDLKVYGFVLHPRLVLRTLRVLSKNA
jgi:hypothetical protein